MRSPYLIGIALFIVGISAVSTLLYFEQLRIVEHLHAATTAADRAIRNASQEIQLVREYQTRLIVDVVTGKLDVREAAVGLPEQVEEPLDTESKTEPEEFDEAVETPGEEAEA